MRDFHARMRFLFRALWRHECDLLHRFWKNRKNTQGIMVLIMLVNLLYAYPLVHVNNALIFPESSCFLIGLLGIFCIVVFVFLLYLMMRNSDKLSGWSHYLSFSIIFLFFSAIVMSGSQMFLYDLFFTFFPIAIGSQLSRMGVFIGLYLAVLLLSLCLGVGLSLGITMLFKACRMYCQDRAWFSDTAVYLTCVSRSRIGDTDAQETVNTVIHEDNVHEDNVEKIKYELQVAIPSLSVDTLVSAINILVPALKKDLSIVFHSRSYEETMYFQTDQLLYKDYIELSGHPSIKLLFDWLDKIFTIRFVCQLNFQSISNLLEQLLGKYNDSDMQKELDWLRGPYYYEVGNKVCTFASKLLGFDKGQSAMPLSAVFPMIHEGPLSCCKALCHHVLNKYYDTGQHPKFAELKYKYSVSKMADKLTLYYLYAVIYRFAERVFRSEIAVHPVLSVWLRSAKVHVPDDVVRVIANFSRDSSMLDVNQDETTITFQY